MDTQKFEKKSMKLVSAVVIMITLMMSAQPVVVDAATNKQVSNRITHAKELLGKSYKRSTVRKTESATNIAEFINSSTKNLLPKAHKKMAREIASVIMRESERYGFDPIFLMAVIQNESSFNPKMKGGVGEIGLMQIKPDTAEWIAKGSKIEYSGADSLYNPSVNIRIGAAFMNKLRDQFSADSSLYLSAYNAGARKVRMMVSENNAPKIYATAVMKRYFAIYSALGANKGTQSERGNLAFANVRNVTAKIARN
jgi:soluble lytic murein transglycosylase